MRTSYQIKHMGDEHRELMAEPLLIMTTCTHKPCTAKRLPRNDLDVDLDGEREVIEEDVEEGLPSRLDASFEDPVPDVIDQRREVLLETDDHET